MKPLLLSILLVTTALAAPAQTVYRCGPDGRSYADAPCKEGRTIDVSDARSAEQAAAAADAAKRERQMANGLRSERLAREAEGNRRSVVALGPATAETGRPLAKDKKKAVPPRKRQRITPGPKAPKMPKRAPQASSQQPAAGISASTARASR